MANLNRWRIERRLRRELGSKSTEEIFTNIHDQNNWGGRESVSGPGSDPEQTAVIRERLPHLIKQYQITSLLDVPCGDFHWMQHLALEHIDYLGADIVKSLIVSNQDRYGTPTRHFQQLNLITGTVPRRDLVLCRDCLVHLSQQDAIASLTNIVQSGSTFLLTTTFPSVTNNRDIPTGHWRGLNLTKPPYNFPEPLELINEHCSEGTGNYKDKSLALWRIADLVPAIKALQRTT